jgi:hypothetical protein
MEGRVRKVWRAASLAAAAALGCAVGLAQEPAPAPVAAVPAVQAPASSAPTDSVAAQRYEVPSGTKVLLALRSSVNTKTAKPGDGVYLSSTFPVVVGSRVLIPAGVYVQGVIDRVVRPGRVKGRAAVNMHFTTMIFPNGTVVTIPGMVDSLPGSKGANVDQEGRIEQAGSKGKDAAEIAKNAETGAEIGAIGGAIGGSPLAGAGYGALAGGAAGIVYTLLTRGAEVDLDQGTTVEMVLQRSLSLDDSNLTGDTEGAASAIQPMKKPGRRKILCPGGGLGCS